MDASEGSVGDAMAGRIRDADIALVRERTAIADVISEYVTLKPAGTNNLKGLCPFHDEKTPSFNVTTARNVYFCLAGETRVLTESGVREIRSLAGGVHRVLTTGGRWVDAPFYSFGEQQIARVHLSRNGVKKTIRASLNHRWFVRAGKGGKRLTERTTEQLKPGDRLGYVFPRSLRTRDGGGELRLSPFGIARGIVFGDGTLFAKGSVALLYGEKDSQLLKWFPLNHTYQRPGGITVADLPAYFKTEMPSHTESQSYLYGWLAGYFAADGDVARDGGIYLHSANHEHLEHVRTICTRLGIGTYGIREYERTGFAAVERPDGSFGYRSKMYRLTFMGSDLTADFFLLNEHLERYLAHIKAFERRGWVVDAVEDHGEVEEVFCPVVDGTHAFVLEDNILTGNCHGCGNGGDAITFVMNIEHFSFTEAVERLAAKAGITLRYEDTPGRTQDRKPGLRQRLYAAHKDAAAYYMEQLSRPEARIARDFLHQRGFDRTVAESYQCGFATAAWDDLTRHLRAKGYTAEELVTGGLSKQARSGSLIDRFRRRLVWPIRDLGGEVIGFGARKLYEDDDGPKYLNTPETPIYKKSAVLYGIERAKREIAKQGRAVVVEGYTDVMACHLSGVPTAVASCGTAFGAEHIGVLRRLLMDTDEFAGEIIFTFDGDAAGQKAALRAFEDDQRFVAQTYIAVSPDNMDPCELRLAKGDAAVRDLVARREPMIAFALRSVLSRYDLDTAEGQVAALRTAAPMVAKIKDRALRPAYARRLAGDLGMEIEPVVRAVAAAGADPGRGRPTREPARENGAPQGRPAPPPDSPQSIVEREALKLAIQQPVLAGPFFDAIDATPYRHPVHAAVREAIAAAGGAASATAGAHWVERVREAAPDLAAKALVGELSVEPLRYDGDPDPRYVMVTLARLQWPAVDARIRQLKSKLQRTNPVTDEDAYRQMFGELISLEAQARGLREQAAGSL